MHYVIHAYDFTDEQAYERRLAARPAHFEKARQLKAEGHFVLGGALLDEGGKMIGSMMLVDFDSEESLNQWLTSDPYVLGQVWDRIDVKPFRKADV